MYKKKLFGFIGAGGHGRESVFLLSQFNNEEYEVYFIDDEEHDNKIGNYKVLSIDNFLKINNDEKYFNISISDSYIREKLAEKMLTNNVKPLSLACSSSIKNTENKIGDGLLQSSYSLITTDIEIGKFFHLNSFSSIHHDCIIGDYVTFATGVRCNGNVKIGDHVLIGSGAVIRNGKKNEPLEIGSGSVIGMGTIVTKNIPPNTKVYGNPAKII